MGVVYGEVCLHLGASPRCLQVEALHGLMLERMDDERYVLATTAAAARLAAQAPTRAALLAHAELAARFAELLQHTCREVCSWWLPCCCGEGWQGGASRYGARPARVRPGNGAPPARNTDQLLYHVSGCAATPLPQVARAADAALDAVAAGSEEWAASVQRLKFEAHNREWLQIVSQT